MPKKIISNLTPYTAARDLYKKGVFLDANEYIEQWVKIDWSKIPSLNRYPDSSSEELREKIARNYVKNTTINNIFIGSGSDEIIDLLIRGYVEADEYIMVMNPSYSLYEVQANINNVSVKSILLNPDFSLNIDEIRKNIINVKIIFLCSPNNPTGTLITFKEVVQILSFYQGILVIDEAYIEFAGLENSFEKLVKTNEQIVILRTFSKAWGLAGIRIGYSIANKKIINTLFKIKDSYNVSQSSQSIALQALDYVAELFIRTDSINRIKDALIIDLKRLNIDVIPTCANFILARIPNATQIYKQLAEKEIIVRDRSKLPYLNNVLRITPGSNDENNQLIRALKKCIKPIDLSKIDGLIFDMDGVLVDVTKSYREAIRQTASYFLNREVLMSEVSEIKQRVGMNNDWDATYALINDSAISYQEVKDYFQSIYLGEKNKKGLINNEDLIIPKKILKKLKNKYKKMGIATGRPKNEVEYVIKKNNLESFFDCVVTMDDVSQDKPAPDSIKKVIKTLNLKNTLYIGDSPSDVVAAERAGIPSIYVGDQNIGTMRFETILQVIEYLL